ncbi:MAG: hypothetical protein FWC38_08900 [Proteobacteria bacterium]|nr:hypothetical protein [Pseudomonadota bacterium]MCL2308317.1 hypothetical protein [Pseudomonadota bacterium]
MKKGVECQNGAFVYTALSSDAGAIPNVAYVSKNSTTLSLEKSLTGEILYKETLTGDSAGLAYFVIPVIASSSWDSVAFWKPYHGAPVNKSKKNNPPPRYMLYAEEEIRATEKKAQAQKNCEAQMMREMESLKIKSALDKEAKTLAENMDEDQKRKILKIIRERCTEE